MTKKTRKAKSRVRDDLEYAGKKKFEDEATIISVKDQLKEYSKSQRRQRIHELTLAFIAGKNDIAIDDAVHSLTKLDDTLTEYCARDGVESESILKTAREIVVTANCCVAYQLEQETDRSKLVLIFPKAFAPMGYKLAKLILENSREVIEGEMP